MVVWVNLSVPYFSLLGQLLGRRCCKTKLFMDCTLNLYYFIFGGFLHSWCCGIIFIVLEGIGLSSDGLCFIVELVIGLFSVLQNLDLLYKRMSHGEIFIKLRLNYLR